MMANSAITSPPFFGGAPGVAVFRPFFLSRRFLPFPPAFSRLNPVPKGRLKIRPVQISFSEEVCWRCFWVEAPCFSRGRQRFSVAGRNPTFSILRFRAGLCIGARLPRRSERRLCRKIEKCWALSPCWILLTATLSYPTTTCFPNAARFFLAPNGINLVHPSSKLIWTALAENSPG